MASDLPPDQPVPLADAEVARRIAEGARAGRGADRTPTLEQLLAAFGEREPTIDARRRVRAALTVAGVRTSPDVALAPPGSRLTLDAGAARRRLRPLLLGAGALVLIVGGAAVAAGLAGTGGKKASDLPPGTTAARPATTAATTPTATGTTSGPVATVTTPAAAQTTTVGTVSTPTAATTTSAATPPPHKPHHRRRHKPAPTLVTVRFVPAEPTYLCVKDGQGRTLYGGTLSAPRVVKAKVVRMNVGLASTRVTVDGRPLPLPSSPAGYQVTRTSRTPLGSGARPEC